MKALWGKTGSTNKRSDSYIYINNFGLYEDICPEVNVLRPEGREDYQIIIVLKGSARFTLNSKEYALNENYGFIYSPKQKQEYTMTVGSKCFWIHFSGTEIEPLLERMGINRPVFYIQNTDGVEKIFNKMLDCTVEENNTPEDLLNALFITLLSGFRENAYSRDIRIVRAINMMKSENFKGRTVNEYAEISGLSVYHFIKRFKEVTHLSPHQYKAKLLVEKAIHLFSTTNMNISEVSEALGFDDSLYFSRFFKKYTGESPKKYLKNRIM